MFFSYTYSRFVSSDTIDGEQLNVMRVLAIKTF